MKFDGDFVTLKDGARIRLDAVTSYQISGPCVIELRADGKDFWEDCYNHDDIDGSIPHAKLVIDTLDSIFRSRK